MPLVVVEVARTCQSCPSQWEGWTADGQHIYARYRSGVLRVGVGDSPDAAVEHAMFGTDSAFVNEIGDRYDGTLAYETLVRATPFISWPIEESTRCR